MTIDEVLKNLGIVDGYAANHQTGIILWLRDEPQPTHDELIAAGWQPVKDKEPSD